MYIYGLNIWRPEDTEDKHATTVGVPGVSKMHAWASLTTNSPAPKKCKGLRWCEACWIRYRWDDEIRLRKAVSETDPSVCRLRRRQNTVQWFLISCRRILELWKVAVHEANSRNTTFTFQRSLIRTCTCSYLTGHQPFWTRLSQLHGVLMSTTLVI